MSHIFEIVPGRKEDKDSPPIFSLGIKMKIDRLETVCSITEYLSHDELKSEINSLKNELDALIQKLESLSSGKTNQGVSGIDDNASPQEVWEVLSSLTDNSLLVEYFNSLGELKRRELADHIFTHCNMFTGKGAFFSAHYVQETALLTG